MTENFKKLPEAFSLSKLFCYKQSTQICVTRHVSLPDDPRLYTPNKMPLKGAANFFRCFADAQLWLITITLIGIVISKNASAAEGIVTVRDQSGLPLKDAVVLLNALENQPRTSSTQPTAIMDQRSEQFTPHVLAVEVGTEVQFPNYDEVRHQVYSVSEAKRFEIHLYKGLPAKPILFDKPGVVTIGCNIHDWMVGFIYVAETPYFAVTDERGVARLVDVPTGRYNMEIWHPDVKTKTQEFSLQDQEVFKKDLQTIVQQTGVIEESPQQYQNGLQQRFKRFDRRVQVLSE